MEDEIVGELKDEIVLTPKETLILREYEIAMVIGIIEQAKKDHKFFNKLKTFAQQAENTSLFHHLRDIEADVFPSTEYEKDARAKGAKLNLVFRMVEMNIPDNYAWMVHRVMKRFWKRGGNFDLQDASELIEERKKIFGE